MADPRAIPEITQAMDLLAQAEQDMPSAASADTFSDALDLLDDYLDAHALDPQTATFVANLRYAHARRIMNGLGAARDQEAWFHYRALLAMRLRPEVERLRREHPGDIHLFPWKR